MKNLILTGITILLLSFGCKQSENPINKSEWQSIGRGNVEWKNNRVTIDDCFIYSKEITQKGAKEFSFQAKAVDVGTEVQIWSGFGFKDRDNRYALGLRGGNSNNIYLCKYQDSGNTDVLAVEPLDFKPVAGEWYKLKVAFWNGNTRVYLNDEEKPRIAVQDSNPVGGTGIILGGGWIETEYKNLVAKNLNEQEIESYLQDSIQYSTLLSLEEKEELRVSQRNNYKPVEITALESAKQIISLNGDWLFMPENDINNAKDAINATVSDKNWHVIPVPAIWNPVKNWLHGPKSGVSDNYVRRENERCENYTFDYKKVKGGYYRHWIMLPEKIDKKKVFVEFDAVAKVAEVWVNGKHAGGHIGMFGDFKLDISEHVNDGKNLLVVKVNNEISEKKADGDKIEEVAITVEVTNDMLNSMAKGMYDRDEGGIWQEVKLIIADEIQIDNVFAKTKTDKADLEITLNNQGNQENVLVKAEIFEEGNQKIIFQSKEQGITLLSKQETKITIPTGKLDVKNWSPENPNLYTMKVSLIRNNKVIDELIEDIGFRTIETRGNKFYLNGNAYWLRGANHPPIALAPNDKKLANNFFKSMHDNNQMVTRTHGTPITKEWADAANKQGVGVSVEGSWPWVMLAKDMPDMYLLDLWKEEMLAMVKQYRNNPSILLWTISNESYFTNYYVKNSSQEVKMQKWKVMSDLIKEIRKIDPTRPITPTSGYIRHQPNLDNVLKPAGIDDGDFDDSHNSYFGWYNPDQYYLYDGIWTEKFYSSSGANSDRPFISQELSSGYPNNDTGHPTRSYIFSHQVPQAWVGDWAYEDHDPSLYLERNAFLTKEIGETIRRTSPGGAGVLHFANICWYRNVYDGDKIESYPIVDAMKYALSPVLLSAELYGRNFYVGDSFKPRICIVNDHEDGLALKPGELKWKIVNKGEILSAGSLKTEAVAHYGRAWNSTMINLPETISKDKLNCELQLNFVIEGKSVAENKYPIIIGTPEWVKVKAENASKIDLFDPVGESKQALKQIGIEVEEIKDLNKIGGNLLIVANADALETAPANWQNVIRFAQQGGNVLLIHPGKHILSLFPNKIRSILDDPGRIVSMHVTESGAFEGIEPLELSYWQPNKERFPTSCRRSYRLNENSADEKLANYLEVHSYLGGDKGAKLDKMSGSPLVQFKVGKGTVIASEMELNIATKDPIAGKTLANLIEMLKRN